MSQSLEPLPQDSKTLFIRNHTSLLGIVASNITMFSSEEGFSTPMACGLRVDTRCKGWDRTMSKILRKIRGVSYDLDAEEGMIYISGKVDPQRILRKITKCGKHAELCWMRTGDERPSVPYGGMRALPPPYHPYNPYDPLLPPPPPPHPLPFSSFPPPPPSHYLPPYANYY